MPAKKITRKKTAKTPPRKKAVKKATTKKKAAKKAVPKKKATTAKGKSIKNKLPVKSKSPGKAAVRKKTITKKKAVPGKTAVTAKAKKRTKQLHPEKVLAPLDNNLPPVEEKSPAVNTAKIIAPGMDNRSLQRAALRNYDNHHIRLSNRKGGIRPAGKKPLW